ncbi:MAG: cytochrome c peroxidase [Bacteroidota bacterium]
MSARSVFGIACLFLLTLASSCSNEYDHQPYVYPTAGQAPPNLPVAPYDYFGTQNPQANKIATLGRVLFYEKALSSNSKVSCGSCHKQGNSFADNKQFSNGFVGKPTARNSMPIQNLTMADNGDGNTVNIASGYGSASPVHLGGFFWDGRESNLVKMVTMPVTNMDEMGNTDVGTAVTRVLRQTYYDQLFRDAFPNSTLSKDQEVAQALATFLSSIKTTNTKFDRARLSFTDLEKQGMKLFYDQYNCNSCHQIDASQQVSPKFANIGLGNYESDKGLFLITADANDRGKFRVPSLHNIELTAPYMHDGSLATLEQVLDHYSYGISNDPNLHPDLREAGGNAKQLNISASEAEALIAFLKTLTDKSVITDPRFSDPFPRSNQ